MAADNLVAAPADKSLVRGLTRRGFVLREFENVFVRRLAGESLPLVGSRSGDSNAQVQLLDVHDENALHEFVQVTTRGFHGEEHEPSAALFQATERLALHPLVETFLVRIDGRAVGASSMEVRGGVAALIGATVQPPFRRRGLQQALIHQRLVRAQELGADFACVHSSLGGATERNAQRLGLQLAYTKAIMVLPEGETA